MKALFFFVLLLTGELAFGLAGAKKLDRRTHSLFANATGVLRMLDGVPGKLVKDRIRYHSKLDTATCSAVYVKKPAWFLTSAACFTDANGHLHRDRRYAAVFVKGVRWRVEMASILIHEKYRKGVASNDLALFSISADERESFSRSHTPIALIPEDSWIPNGQRVKFVSYGGTNNAGENFGVERIKEFAYRYPDPEDVQKAGDNLRLSPTEQLLTFESVEGPGINCPGDSGGGAFVELAFDPSKKPQVFLQSLILGKVGSNGDLNAKCDEIDRYAVNLDLRFAHNFLKEGVAKAETAIQEAVSASNAYFAKQKNMYGKVLYPTYVRLAKDDYDKIAAIAKPLKVKERAKTLHIAMSLKSSALLARDQISPTGQLELRLKDYVISNPNHPWGKKYSDWITANRTRKSGDDEVYLSEDTTPYVGLIRVRNVGDSDVFFSHLKTKRSIYDELWVQGKKSVNFTLKPGQKIDFATRSISAERIEKVILADYKGPTDLEVYAIPYESFDVRFSGKNAGTVKAPRMVRFINRYKTADISYISLHNIGKTAVTLREPRVVTASRRGGYGDDGPWFSQDKNKQASYSLAPGRGTGTFRIVSGPYRTPVWWNLYSVDLVVLGEGTTVLNLNVNDGN